MKYLVSSYTFNPVSKIITFLDQAIPFGTFVLENVLMITNVTKNTIIYNFADPTFSGTTLSGDNLTLAAGVSTVGMSSADRLQIYLDLPASAITSPTSDSSYLIDSQEEEMDADDYDNRANFPNQLYDNDQDPDTQYPQLMVIDSDSKPFSVSGVDIQGAKHPIKVAQDGALILADAPPPLTTFLNGTVLISTQLQALDTTGYNSISVQVTGTFGSTVFTAYTSVDAKNWYAVAGSGLPLNNNTPVTTTQIGAAGVYQFPANAKYFMLAVTTAGAAASLVVMQQLKLTPLASLGFQTVVGNVNAGSAIANAPVQVAGSDGSYVRRILTDTAGVLYAAGNTAPGAVVAKLPITIGGIDAGNFVRNISTDTLGVQNVNAIALPPTSVRGIGLEESSALILAELRQLNFFLRQLPLYLNGGINITDEDKDYRDDPNFTN